MNGVGMPLDVLRYVPCDVARNVRRRRGDAMRPDAAYIMPADGFYT